MKLDEQSAQPLKEIILQGVLPNSSWTYTVGLNAKFPPSQRTIPAYRVLFKAAKKNSPSCHRHSRETPTSKSISKPT